MKRTRVVYLLSSIRKFIRIPAFSLLILLTAAVVQHPASPSLAHAAPPPSEGTITVVTVPERVEVWIDNGYAGLSPIRQKKLTAGTYTLRLVDPSQQVSAVEAVAVRAGEHLLVERTLSSRYGKLRVDSDPPGADVVIVTELGKTPVANDFMNPGRYRIELRHPLGNYLPVAEEVTISDGQQTASSHKLAKPEIFTKKRCIQLALGVGAAAGFALAVVEQGKWASYRQKADFAREAEPDGGGDGGKADEYSLESKDAATKRTVALVAAGALTVALQVTIFIW